MCREPLHYSSILALSWLFFFSILNFVHLYERVFPMFFFQASVPDWLILLNLSQYEQVLMDAGYDDIDFVADITTEELQDIGITKKGA